MQTHNSLLALCCVLAVSPLVLSISIVGPRVLRPHGAYRVAISGSSRDQSIYLAIEGRRSTGESFTQSREVQIQTGISRIYELQVGDPGPGQYSLIARTTSGPEFSSSKPLIYQPRSFCVFIQTDKRVYQPKDTVYFRAVALDRYLLPLSGIADVSILDAGGTPIRQWVNTPLERGIISGELVLADEPGLGEWSIQVEIHGQKYSRHILVADYVLPKFQMDLEFPKEVLFSDGRFTINVTAKHFNGQPVRGELTLSTYAVFFSGVLQPVFSSPARKVIDFNGQTDITYDLKTDLDLAEDAARPLVIEAVLEEKDTLIKQNITGRILLLRTPYRLKVAAPEYFKPELPYNVQIEVVDPSSGKIIDENGEVNVERFWDDGAPANVTTLQIKQGLAIFTFVPDFAHTNSTLNLVIKYKEVTERVINVQKSDASNGEYLTIELLTKGTSVGNEMRARITATQSMDVVHYVLLGRGDILEAKTIELSPARPSVDIRVSVTKAMAPGCILLAWHPRLEGNVLASAVYAPQQKLLQNQVSIQLPPGNHRPGNAIEIEMSAEPGSHVALVAEDRNAIKAGLASDNGLGVGLDMHTIEREVESFSGLMHSVFKNEDHQPSYGLDLGGNATMDVFHNAGLVILTDGIVKESVGGEHRPSPPPESATRPPLAGPFAFSHLPPPEGPREYLIHRVERTWTMANFSIGSNRKSSTNKVTPMKPGDWLVGGFAVHPTLGLGLAEPKVVSTSVPLTITSELPAVLQRGETVAAVVILTSSLTVETSVEVTLHNSEQYFEFEPLENSVDSSKKIELFRRLQVTLPAQGSASTAFLITVVKSGDAPVIVEATGNGVSASLFKTIEILDGYEEELWSWTVLDGRKGVARANITLNAPAGYKIGPASLRAAGDMLAPAIHAARSMDVTAADPVYALRPLAVAGILLNYLQVIDRDELAIKTEARNQASIGYQRLMAFRKSDGSFAAEIDDNAQGDVWMTGLAVRFLSIAGRFVQVSPGPIQDAARWLVLNQSPSGEWPIPQPSDLHSPQAQRPLPLAANSLIALLSLPAPDYLHKNAINKAIDFIAKGLSPNLDAYTLAIMTTALYKTNHPQASMALEMLDAYTNSTADTIWWSRPGVSSQQRSPWLKSNSAEASTAAWGLKALLAAQLHDKAVPVARYLLSALRPNDVDPEQLESLSELAESMKTSTKMRLMVNVTGLEELKQFNIDNDNALIVQTQVVRNARTASAMSEGRGISVLGLSARSSSNVTGAWPRFTLDPRVDAVSTKDRLQLSICVGFVTQGNETRSGFTLLTVQLPSGYLADINTLTELKAANHIVSAKLERDGSRVVARVRSLDSRERCATLAAPRALPVANQRPGYATMIDLYDSSHRARVFFLPQVASPCDVCRNWPSCANACGATARQQGSDINNPNNNKQNEPDSANVSLVSTLLVMMAMMMPFIA